MRICYLIPGALSAGPLGPAELERRAAFLGARAAEGTEVVVRDTPDGPPSIETEAEEASAATSMLARLPEIVAAEAPDAVIVGCFGDPGLAAARETAGVPVIGPAEASMRKAAGYGRFAVVSVTDDVLPLIGRLAEGYGLGDRLASLRAVNVAVLDLSKRRDRVLELLEREGRIALADGAGALVLGCMTMGFLDVASDLQRSLGVPVVNPVEAALGAAESAVRDIGGPGRGAP